MPGAAFLPYVERQILHDLGAGEQVTGKRAAHRQRAEVPLTFFNCPTRRRAIAYPFRTNNEGGTGGPLTNSNEPDSVGRTDYGSSLPCSCDAGWVVRAAVTPPHLLSPRGGYLL